MTTKPEDKIEDDNVQAFTPEEEAQLDAAARGETVVDTKVETKTDEAPSTEDEIAKLKKELADANARTEAERTAREAAEKKQVSSIDDMEAAEQARIKAADDKVDADIALADRDVKDLTRQLREAKENGELDKEIEINDKLLDAKINLKKIADDKERFGSWKENRSKYWEAERKKAEKRIQSGSTDTFNREAFTEKALEWIDKNPQFKTDKKFQSRATAAHYEAEAEGIAPDTPEYFSFIDKRLGLVKEDTTTTDDDDAASQAAAQKDAATTTTRSTTQPKPATKVTQLPPSHTGGTQRTEGTRIKKLTAAEREAADISGMTPEEYWDEKYGNKTN